MSTFAKIFRFKKNGKCNKCCLCGYETARTNNYYSFKYVYKFDQF